jgi:hypothetical protein
MGWAVMGRGRIHDQGKGKGIAGWINNPPSSVNRHSLIVLINNRPAKEAGLRLRKKYEATSRPDVA